MSGSVDHDWLMVRSRLIAGLLLTAYVIFPNTVIAQTSPNQSIQIQMGILIHPTQDECDQKSNSEIVVCGKRKNSNQYRIPPELREYDRISHSDDVNSKLGPSMICRQAGNMGCAKAAIPVFTIKNGKTQIGPFTPN